MVISENFNIKVDRSTSKNYPGTKHGDIITIEFKDMSKSSREVMEVSCDYCGATEKTAIRNYYRQIDKIDKFSCTNKECKSKKKDEIYVNFYGSKNHAVEKGKLSNLKKYGVENVFQLELTKQKTKKTNLEKYGAEHHKQSNEIAEKIKQTNLKRYGVENAAESDEIKEKTKQSNLKKYGVEHAIYLKSTKEKIKKTNLEKYGAEWPSNSLQLQEKRKETFINKYGVNNPFSLTSVKEKIKQTNLEKYGTVYSAQSNIVKEKTKNNNIVKYGTEIPSQSDTYRKEKFKIAQDSNYITYDPTTKLNTLKCCKGEKHNYETTTLQYYTRQKAKTATCTICYPISETSSIKEKELQAFVASLTTIVPNYKHNRKELDVFVPHKKIGFEFNGVYWHSEEFVDKNYHKAKQDHFQQENIRVIHIWEDDWDIKQDIIKSQIRNLLGMSDKIYARKTTCKEISNTDARVFLDDNHLQGAYSRNTRSIGLFFNEELVSVMTFDQQEGRKKMEENGWNLSRFCSKKNTSVIGGASKLLKFFIAIESPKRVISYADADWSQGGLYETLGFEKVSHSKPDYKYLVNGVREHKSKWRKKKGDIRTETQIMEELGIPRIYDCGKIKYEKNVINKKLIN